MKLLRQINEAVGQLPSLPYAKDALEPFISKETMHYHFDKHYKGYHKKLSELIPNTKYENMPLEEIVKTSSDKIFNNAAQVWNHFFFWDCMTPNAKELDPSSSLGKVITTSFGSIVKFEEEFKKQGTTLFGSGWIWLVKSGESLKIEQKKDAECPLTESVLPLLVCDVWEHSYYLDHQNERDKYIDAFWHVVNWNFVQNRFEGKVK